VVIKKIQSNFTSIRHKRILIIGYGSQARAQAGNLRDNGLRVSIGLRDGSKSAKMATDDGFDVVNILDHAKDADIIMILIPDECQAELYNTIFHTNIKSRAALGFAHGFSINFNLLNLRDDIDVFMVVPKGPGRYVREMFLSGMKIPCMIAIHQDYTGDTQNIAESYASGISSGDPIIIKTTFQEECEANLFAEQAITCGGMIGLIQVGFKTLVDSGCSPEVAYIECLNGLKAVINLLSSVGIEHFYKSISNVARYGGLMSCNKIANQSLYVAMNKILSDIRSGQFASDMLNDMMHGSSDLNETLSHLISKEMEVVGKHVRSIMSES